MDRQENGLNAAKDNRGNRALSIIAGILFILQALWFANSLYGNVDSIFNVWGLFGELVIIPFIASVITNLVGLFMAVVFAVVCFMNRKKRSLAAWAGIQYLFRPTLESALFWIDRGLIFGFARTFKEALGSPDELMTIVIPDMFSTALNVLMFLVVLFQTLPALTGNRRWTRDVCFIPACGSCLLWIADYLVRAFYYDIEIYRTPRYMAYSLIPFLITLLPGLFFALWVVSEGKRKEKHVAVTAESIPVIAVTPPVAESVPVVKEAPPAAEPVRNSYVDNSLPLRAKTVRPTEVAEEIKKYKALLDEGAITQEEYDRKKQQLLTW